MRIAMFTDCYHPVINGVVTSIASLKLALENDGHEVFLFAPGSPGYVDTEPNVFRFHSFVWPYMKENRFSWPWPLAPVASLARKRVEAVHVHTPFNVGLIGLVAGAWLGRPRFFTHHTLWEEYSHYLPLPEWFMKWFAVNLCKSFAQASAAVITPSEDVKQRFAEQGVTRPIHVIPTGIDPALFREGDPAGPLQELGLTSEDRLFLYIGRLGKEKSIDFLLRTFAMRELPGARLAIVGDGPYRPELEALSRELGLEDRVRFLGYRARTELRHYLAASRGLVFASQTETQGLVLLEAQAAGVPVLAVRGPGVTEAVANGTSGVLVAPGDRETFWNEWLRLDQEDDYRARLAAGAPGWADGFSARAMAGQMTALYKAHAGHSPIPDPPRAVAPGA